MRPPRSRVYTYERIANDLREAMVSGALTVGATLPGRRDLCDAYDTTTVTVRRAMQVLVEEGLIRCSQGRPALVIRVPGGPLSLEQQYPTVREFWESADLLVELNRVQQICLRMAEAVERDGCVDPAEVDKLLPAVTSLAVWADRLWRQEHLATGP
ncbi:MAG: GntR family transcriptional regulator [Mycobacterium sp.]